MKITEDCITCGACVEVCPANCIAEGSPFVIDEAACMICGVCASTCPVSACVELK